MAEEYVFEVRRENGSIMYNGLTKGRVLMGVLRCPPGESGRVYYPGTLYNDIMVTMARSGSHQINIGNGQGPDGTIQGFVTWTWRDWGHQAETIAFVFAKKRVDPSAYGIELINDAGEQLADPDYPSPQWAGTVYCEQNARLTYTTPDNYVASVHRATVSVRPGADKIIVAYLPDSGASDTWYNIGREAIFATEGSVDVDVTVYTKTPNSYTLPSLHLFAVNSMLSSADADSLQIRTEGGALTFDAMAEGMSIVDTTAVTFNTDGYAVVPIQSPGVGNTVPYFEIAGTYADQNDYRTLGCWKRVGSQLMTSAIVDSKRPRTGVSPYTIGGTDLREVMEVDVSQLGAYNGPGTPAPYSAAPIFTLDPITPNSYVKPGSTVTFTVDVAGSPAPTLQWCKFDNNQTLVEIPGETRKSYSFTAQLSDNNDVFFCRANNVLGQTNSGQAFVHVSDFNPAHIDSYSMNPQSVSVGDTVHVSMTASGDYPVTCTINGPEGTIVTGTGSVSASFTATSDSQGYYGFIAHNGTASQPGDDQRSLNLAVSGALPPRITQQPSDVVLTQGDVANISCSAEPAGVEFYWYKTRGANTEFYGVGSPIRIDTSVSGIFSYYCQVRTGQDNYVYSRQAQVTVNPGSGGGGGGDPTPDPNSLHITSYSSGGTYPAGTVVSLNMTADGVPSPSCSIFGPAGTLGTGTGQASGSFTLTSSTAGSYTYSASNSAGTVQTSVNVAVQGTPPPPPPVDQRPDFSQQPIDCYVTSGEAASFSCQASPTTSYQWYQNNAQMPGQNGSGLWLGAVDTGMNLVEFYCVAINGTAQRQSVTATLHVAPAQAPTTYQSYNYPLNDYVEDSGSVSWSASDNWTDSGFWANGPGDSSLYDIMGTLTSGIATGSSFGAWHSMSSGVSWTCTANTKTNRIASIDWQIRHRASGNVVSYGTLNMTAYNGAIA